MMHTERRQGLTGPGELKLLQLREFAFNRPPNLFNRIGFSKAKVQNFFSSKSKLEHDGCINAAKWTEAGDCFLTGSDDCQVKVWQLSSTVDHVTLKHTVKTHHRGNILCVDMSRDDPNMVISAALDGTVRSNYLDRPHAGTTLYTSEDIVHMVQFDHEQPNVMYTAEQVGCITRIDLRSNQKEILFEHTVKVYEGCPAYQTNTVNPIIPKWNGKGAVKAIAQNPTVSTPHLLVGGKGFMAGFIDLRSSSRIPANDGSIVNPFLKLWSPLFPMDLDSPEKIDLHQRYLQKCRYHPFSRKSLPISSASSPKACQTSHQDPIIDVIGDSEIDSFIEDEVGDDEIDDESVDEEEEDDELSILDPSISNDEDGDSDIESGFLSRLQRNLLDAPMKPLNHVTISGLKVSKDGQRILANFQNDQIYLFNFKCKETVGGVDAMIGGHMNHDTFLKTVDFFGPNDEYVVAGSDSGHLWVWDSQPTTTICDDYGIDITSTNCNVVGVFRADKRTCNGVVSHPTMPLLLSYGIDNDAKLWSYKTPDDPVEDNVAFLGIKDSDLANMGPSSKKDQYDLCRHDGPRDSERYNRISIPFLAYPNDSIVKRSMYNYPSITEGNKTLAKAKFPEAYQPDFPHLPHVVHPFNFIDTLFHQRLHFFRNHVLGYGTSKKMLPAIRQQYFTSDVFPYMPSDTVYYVLQENHLFSERETMNFALKLCVSHEKINKLWKCEEEPGKVMKVLHAIYQRRGVINKELGRNFLDGMIEMELHQRKKSLYNYFMMSILELLRMADEIKTIGNNAFRNKDLDCAHYFYCKAHRYFKHVLDIRLICPTIVRRRRESRSGPNSRFQETFEFSDGASVSMQVAMGTPTNLEGIPEEIQRVAREAFMNSDAPLRSISNALGALVEGRIPAVQASTNTNSNTSSNSQSTSAVVPCTHEEEENGDKDNIDDEFWQKEFPDEWSCEEESTESPSSKSESSLDLPTDVIELPMEIDQIETCKIDIEKKWSSRRLDKTVESFVEILYVDVIPEAMQKTLSNLAATFISMEKYLDALHVCNDAFHVIKTYKLKPDAKLLFRKGSANIQLHHYEEAIVDLQQALNLCPKDTAINNKLKEAKRLNEVKRKREIKAYSKMFDS